MRARVPFAALVVLASAGTFAACGSCKKDDLVTTGDASTVVVVPEVVPRCRGEAHEVALPGDDVIVGDVAMGARGLLVGLVRSEGGKRIASVLEASRDLGTTKTIDLGTSFGDDPPPSPRWKGDVAYAAVYARSVADAGPVKLRELRVVRLDQPGKPESTVVQQADESTAFDLAWTESGAGIVAWDEDAPPAADASVVRDYAPEGRGFVKVQVLGSDARRVASPESSDAESPRVVARPGGFWLAWLARRAEDGAYEVESPGEKRAYRWVEVVALDAAGVPTGAPRRITPERGRVVAFDVEPVGADLVVLVQDETASSEAAGSRVTRYRIGAQVEALDVVDGGVGATAAELVPAARPAPGVRWLSWADTAEHAHLSPLSGTLSLAGGSSLEPAFEGGRVLAAASDETLYALVAPAGPAGGGGPGAGPAGAAKIRQFACFSKEVTDAAK